MPIKGIVLGHLGDGRRGCHWHWKMVGSVVSCVFSLQRRGEQGRMTAKLLMLSTPSQDCSVCSYCFGIWCSPQWMLNHYSWAYDRKVAVFPLLFRYFWSWQSLCVHRESNTPCWEVRLGLLFCHLCFPVVWLWAAILWLPGASVFTYVHWASGKIKGECV